MSADSFAIDVNGVYKSYEGYVALGGVTFQVMRGEIFGLVGHNGAGKTTLIEILEGLRQPDRGEVSVLGFDPTRRLRSIKERIGVQLQRPSFYGKLKVIELLNQFRNYYHKKTDLEGLLTKVSLQEKRNSYVKDLSGGQGQRLAIALALVNDPELVFLDEPTAGLDPSIRRQLWQTIRQIKLEGKTAFLTTHYLEEAERLCDRVCILDGGQILAVDSPSGLVSRVQGSSARISLTTTKPLELRRLRSIRTKEQSSNGVARYVLEADNTGPAVVDLINCIGSQNSELIDLQVARATLEDAFIELTGRET